MKKIYTALFFFTIAFAVSISASSCKKNNVLASIEDIWLHDLSATPFDSTEVAYFFGKHPLLQKYQVDVKNLYRKHEFKYVWYNENGINEFANVLYNKIINLPEEGIIKAIPYKTEFDLIYEGPKDSKTPNVNSELLTTALYFFYIDQVYHGIDAAKSNEMEWFLPREKQTYGTYTDSLLIDPSLIKKDKKALFSQYYLLRDQLKKYRQIEKKGGWDSITLPAGVKTLKIGDSVQAIGQVRKRLFLDGFLTTDSESRIYDEALADAVVAFKKTRGIKGDKLLYGSTLNYLSTPVNSLIETLVVNMERCRWVTKDIAEANEVIAVNIPSYELNYFKSGKSILNLNVVVGKTLNKTVIFSAPMKYIVFSPYWNIPTSIIKKEILPGIANNSNYLAQHNMEWNNGRVRQKPGSRNSLGLVKFLFPNSNAIYLHDTPSKYLFSKDKRAFSHGCIRVQNPELLAETILKSDPKWDAEKIQEAMHNGKESWYTLKNKIPVYIGYFTSWVDEEGVLHFYDDVYKRDAALAALLFEK
ncbi:L,D-transpeptidase family protein [Flavobacterium muglaense]|uniref:L,D-transpeptidase family protein n=1 Tax=Flavobacterium muglaense TaxID=2764716 RepID=A0A923N3D5_9FLAO|nr:L,D-transpeptidase family protein [Flavobacterium muglaense]MBC5838325.1 L,D-transpeptidase family protein [Flavobacterium muglaense]MBC5844898.1 L,D-transpeptidase family protein [Flavobacterium muglaense]